MIELIELTDMSYLSHLCCSYLQLDDTGLSVWLSVWLAGWEECLLNGLFYVK